MDTTGSCYAQDGMKTVPAASQCWQSTRHSEGLNMYLLYSYPIFYPDLAVCEYNWILCYTFDIKGATGNPFVMNHVSCMGWLKSSYHTIAGVLNPFILNDYSHLFPNIHYSLFVYTETNATHEDRTDISYIKTELASCLLLSAITTGNQILLLHDYLPQ